MKRYFSQVAKFVCNSTLSFLLPSFCYSCGIEIKKRKALLCTECFSSIKLLDPIERCPTCFSDLQESRICPKCQKSKKSLCPNAFCFEEMGPAHDLAAAFCNKDIPQIDTALSAFLFLQIENLGWPYPDLVTYVPKTFFETSTCGYNPSKLLAKKLAAHLKKPCEKLASKQYRSLQEPCFLKKEKKEHAEKVVVVDAIRCRETVLCSEALLDFYESVYVLTLC